MKPKVKLYQIPLLFEKNEGQIDSNALYLTHGKGCTFYFRPHDILLVLKKKSAEGERLLFPLIIEFVDASSDCQVKGIEEQACKSNYFIGNDPAQWKTSLPNYSKLRYETLYRGIDVVFYGNRQQLEYDIIVSPGVHPETIRLRLQGMDQLSLTSEGHLRLLISGGEEILMTKPYIYQVEGENRIPIEGHFVLLGGKDVGFALGDYDKTRKLVIDPTLVYSTYLGGNQSDEGNAIAVDENGNAYVTGGTNSTTFPTTSGAYQSTLANLALQNAFITKINSDGTSLIYSTYLGGDNSTLGNAIALDSNGNAYLTGLTSSNNFPTTLNALQPSLGGPFAQNAFVTKLRSDGQALLYSTYLGGDNFDEGRGIALDIATNAYVTGSTSSTNFPTTSGAYQTTPNNNSNEAFVSKIRADGQALVYSTYLGGNNFDLGNGIAVDSSGHAYVTGHTISTDFPTTSNAFQAALGAPAAQNAFITKLNQDGSHLIYSSYLGGNAIDDGNAIAIDNQQNAYVAGTTESPNFPTTSNAFQTTLGGGSDAFVTKINQDGSSLIYSTYLGGNNDDEGNGVAVDGLGNAYVTGSTRSNNFPITTNAFQSALATGATENAFVTKLNKEGSALIYSSYLGGDATDIAQGIALDNVGSAYLTGQTNSSHFPTTSNAYQEELNGTQNALIAKFAIGTPLIFSIHPNQGPTTGGTEVIITGTNFEGTTAVHFGGNAAIFIVNSNTQITAISPPGLGTVDVTVTTSLGTSPTSPTDLFTYIQFKQITITILSVSPNPAQCKQPVTLIATVTPSSVTGSVSFLNGSTLIGTTSLINGTAQLQNSHFSAGTHHLTAVYSGDTSHFASTSLSVPLTVLPPCPCEPVCPPTDLRGRQITKKFAMQTDLINVLTWKAPQRGPEVVAYEIYRDSMLKEFVTRISSQEQLCFVDHNRKKGKTHHYFIVSVDANGNYSVSSKVTIRGKKPTSKINKSKYCT